MQISRLVPEIRTISQKVAKTGPTEATPKLEWSSRIQVSYPFGQTELTKNAGSGSWQLLSAVRTFIPQNGQSSIVVVPWCQENRKINFLTRGISSSNFSCTQNQNEPMFFSNFCGQFVRPHVESSHLLSKQMVSYFRTFVDRFCPDKHFVETETFSTPCCAAVCAPARAVTVRHHHIPTGVDPAAGEWGTGSRNWWRTSKQPVHGVRPSRQDDKRWGDGKLPVKCWYFNWK